MELAIAVVSNRDHAPDFTKSLTAMVARLAAQPLFNSVTLKIAKNCSSLPNARQSMIDECLAEKISHILCLDDDMTFPSDLCHRLAAHKKRVIACNSMRKNPDELFYTARDLDGNWIASKGKGGLQEVESVGMALMLIDTDIFKKNPRPHFEVRWSEERQTYTGEDIFFCRKIRGSGEKIYIDHATSNLCGHVGSLTYTFAFYDRFKAQ